MLVRDGSETMGVEEVKERKMEEGEAMEMDEQGEELKELKKKIAKVEVKIDAAEEKVLFGEGSDDLRAALADWREHRRL